MLVLKNIKKKYKDRVIIDGINLVFPDKGLFFITGDSGSGKTSLLNIIGMLDNDFTGEVSWNGNKLKSKCESEIQKYHLNELGFIFQDFNLLEYLSVRENIELLSMLENKKENFANSVKSEDILKKLKLTKVVNNKAKELSGGEKQRVSIARILCRDCKVILADEPTGNLDSGNTEIIFEILSQLAKEKLVIVVTHNEQAALKYGDDCIKISDGKIVDQSFICEETECKKTNSIQRKRTIKALGLGKLNLKYMKYNRKKLISSMLMMVFCVTTIALFLSAFQSVTHISDVINKSVLESDKITVVNKNENFRLEEISQEFISKLVKEKNIKHCIPYYEETLILSSETTAETIYGQYNVVDDSNIFDCRYEDLEGRLPNKSGEVTISKEIADTFFPEGNIIGRKLDVETMGDQKFTCEIVGYRTENNQNNYGIYISKEQADEISSKLIKMEYQTFTFVNDTKYNGIFSVYVENNGNERNTEYNIVYGRRNKNKNEIMININSINQYLECMGVRRNYTAKELSSGKLKKDDLNLIFGEEVCLSATIENTKLADVQIVGIYETENVSDNITFYLNDELIRSLSKTNINSLDVYVNSSKESKMKSIYNLISEYGYSYSSVSGNIGATVTMKVSMVFEILSAIMIFVILVSVIMMRFTAKNMLSDRIYEVGVLKTMGVSNSNILFMFVFQNTMIGFCSAVISSLITYIIVKVNWISYEGISLLSFNGWICTIAILASVLICNLSGIYDMLLVSKKSAIECIRNSHT
ncbi:MAG: ATP-binding cassette domain-containing protein [Lachnospiraceae bacterium]|nr:ATP-binding cassette domain-containing protein [Lachnospiraceae bacterium]